MRGRKQRDDITTTTKPHHRPPASISERHARHGQAGTGTYSSRPVRALPARACLMGSPERCNPTRYGCSTNSFFTAHGRGMGKNRGARKASLGQTTCYATSSASSLAGSQKEGGVNSQKHLDRL